jgi:hypothetical protein
MKLGLINSFKSVITESVAKPIGCKKFPSGSYEFKLCNVLNSSQFRETVSPTMMKLLDSKKKKWSEAIPKNEQDKIFEVLGKLKEINPDKKWQWPSPDPRGRFLTGTIDQFIENRLPELAFIYDMEHGTKWSPINKLDTNYSDTAVLITDIISQSKSFDAKEIYDDIVNNDESKLRSVMYTIEKYSDVIYDKFLSDPETIYNQNSLFNSMQGEEIEGFVVKILEEDGWTILHRGEGGDPIDILLGIDIIIEKGGEIKTVQCKKVWNIQYQESTLMKPEEGSYRITGQPYVSKQRNLDFVGYGTESGEVIVSKRQKEVIRKDNEYQYTNKMVLPSPQGKSKYFYIDKESVIATSNNLKY